MSTDYIFRAINVDYIKMRSSRLDLDLEFI